MKIFSEKHKIFVENEKIKIKQISEHIAFRAV